MDTERTADVVQIWRLSDLSLLKTLSVPAIVGDSTSMYPLELKALDDGSVLMNTYYCGFFRVTDIASKPQITHVLELPQPKNGGCSVPLVVGKFWVMPVAYAHRFATIDISDPAHPVEVASRPNDWSPVVGRGVSRRRCREARCELPSGIVAEWSKGDGDAARGFVRTMSPTAAWRIPDGRYGVERA